MKKTMFWGIILALLVVVSACEKPILDGGQTKKKGFRVNVELVRMLLQVLSQEHL